MALLRERTISADRVQAIHQALDEENVGVVFQPIVDVQTHETVAYEALARSRSEAFPGVLDLFEAAVQVGRVAELGRLHRRQATAACRDYPLFLNVYPNEFDYGWLVRPDDPMFRHRWPVTLEVTEAVPLKYFDQCESVLKELREKGVTLAVDDLGAGYSNLKYISDLAPDVVKLDRELVAGIRQGTRQYRLLRSLVALCKDMDAKVVAEGVETVLELVAVRAAGVDYVQGYLLARPGNPPPPPVWPDTLA